MPHPSPATEHVFDACNLDSHGTPLPSLPASLGRERAAREGLAPRAREERSGRR